MNRLVALDPATQTGWALVDDTGAVRCGSINLGKTKGYGERFANYRALLEKLRPTRIYAEAAVSHGSMKATMVLYGLQAILQEYAFSRNIEVTLKNPKQIKLWATKDGDASKAQMEAQAACFVDFPIPDDNAADAVCLLHWAMEELKCQTAK